VAGTVIVVMTSIAVPSALRYRTVRVAVGNASSHMDVELTPLWRVDAFVVAYNWTQSLLRSIIPVFILIFTGIAIVAALRRRPSMRVDDRKVAVRRRIARSCASPAVTHRPHRAQAHSVTSVLTRHNHLGYRDPKTNANTNTNCNPT